MKLNIGNINWKVRFKNPIFWVQIVITMFTTILAYFGMNWEQMTSWFEVFNLLFKAIQNPVVVVSIIVGIFNIINDPTTKGIEDSERALTYDKPA